MLNVYKASAGSGKTFQLVVEYLKLILDNPFNYKHILAVTFTNKATNEMKSRILDQLYQLANNQKSDYVAVLQNETGKSEQNIRERAGQVLKNILHDYNRFSINTIDSFTQKVIKSFNRELGISPNFAVDIDNDIILEEAIDRMFARLDSDRKLLDWLREYSRERIEENRSQRLDSEIQKLGSELFKERFQVFFPEDGDSVYTRENLNELVKELRKIVAVYENTLKKYGQELVEEMNKSGLSPADFSGGAVRSIGNFFVKLAGGDQPNFTKTVLESGETAEKWVTKTNKRREEILALVEQNFRPKLNELIQYHTKNNPRYNSALSVLKQVRTLGILIDLKEEIKDLLREKDTLPLSDSNLLLSKIIGESDSPFVYEKLGTYYQHFMLDEFQDTSSLQWKNFKPLLLNSLAEGHSNLIVGDVKQSIYRWRNSDWNILAEQLNRDFTPEQKKDFTLEKNWRSDRNIIDFNNEVFGQLMNVFEAELFSEIENNEPYLEKFRNIYAAYQQIHGKKEAEKTGYVRVNFLENETFRENSTSMLVEQVKYLQDMGIQPAEIAILIRKNREGADIIEAFLEAAKQPENAKYELSVLSNESLFLHASRGVLFIIQTVAYLVDPENAILKATLLNLWMNWLKPAQNRQNADETTATVINWQVPENMEDAFQEELAEKMAEVKQKVLLSSLDETITHIASIFGLFNLTIELPFIQTLIDKSGELKTSLSNDLSNLLFWWNEKGYETSVSVNEEVESIRLLTVHKAKGLEYKAILIPYFNWDTSWGGFNTPLLWCEHPEAPFNRFPRLPVSADNTMKSSEFAPDYNEEKVNSLIDTMNLVYVAFTRAKSVLMINAPQPKITQQGKESGKGVDKMLLTALRQMDSEAAFTGAFNPDKMIFEFGQVPPNEKKTKTSNTISISKYRFNDFTNRIKLRLSGEDFLVEGQRHHSEKNTGKLVHEILSEIENIADVSKACTRAFIEGKMDENERQEIEKIILENLKLEVVKNWFDGTFQTLNERDVLTPDKLLRPDRIMYSDRHAVVVDYKTGEKIPGKYNRQVERYAHQLKETGFTKVEGYLWYLADNEVVKVCEL